MFESSQKQSFLKQADEAREKRQAEKKRLNAVLKLQTLFRGYLARKRTFIQLKSELEEWTSFNRDKKELNLTASEIYSLVGKFLFIYKLRCKYLNKKKRKKEYGCVIDIYTDLSAYLVFSIANGDMQRSYLSLILSKERYQEFINQSNSLLVASSNILGELDIKDARDNKTMTNVISLFMLFNDISYWKCFNSSKSKSEYLTTVLKEIEKSYLTTLEKNGLFYNLNFVLMQSCLSHSQLIKPNIMIYILKICFNVLRCFKSHTESRVCLTFCIEILTVPYMLKLLEQSTDASDITSLRSLLSDESLIDWILATLFNYNNLTQLMKDKDDLNLIISFLGNLCSLMKCGGLETSKANLDIFIQISLTVFSNLIAGKKTTLTKKESKSKNDSIKWHPLFGYLKLKTQINNFDVLINVLQQLRFIWSHQLIHSLCSQSLTSHTSTSPPSSSATTAISAIQSSSLVAKSSTVKALFERILTKPGSLLNQTENGVVYKICSFYKQVLILMNEPRIEILSALSLERELLVGLFEFFKSLGAQCGLKDLIKQLEIKKDFNCHPVFDGLYLLCSLVLYLITVLDEEEFYTKQDIFSLADYKVLASFLNQFVFQIIWHELIDLKSLESNQFFSVFHQTLISLHNKDSRKSFTDNPDQFWIIKDLRIQTFLDDLEKDKPNAVLILQKIPHVIPLRKRTEILKNKIDKDKSAFYVTESPSIRISIRRNKLVEDAYANLANLTPALLKCPIRVCFINEFGLKEPGIDQDGVFKEFLQELILKLLNPTFNLFKLTDDQLLYPSSSSYYVEDHLQMFEFAGKLIGKAVYESQVVNAEFAPFFLRHLIGFRNQNYSFLDDLVTLDQELYKNLNSIKREENVSDLELTFTYSESHLGKLITEELLPSGEFIKVTNENKVKYIHLMAHFKLYKQIKDQIHAFNEGFKSMVSQEWLNMFSTHEIQHLISGSVHDINIDDLKKNVQYWGGLHSNHRLIKWLWEIVEKEFNREERGLFLKFVTSCSKPPLLGFSSLNPPFTIRCVEIEEEEETIYDSSFKGFFKTILNIGGTNTSRLPTSSTCFNLLKLPNYAKKAILKEKLLYAIKSNSGFELS